MRRQDAVPDEPGRVAVDVLDSLLEGCQVISPDWRYLFVNDTVVRQAKRTRAELLGRTMMECYPGIEHSPMFAELRRCMETRAHHVMENEFTFPDGSKGSFELRFVPVPEGVCVLSLDVTERKRAEASVARLESQLLQAQKMEAIGRLAGGVAHDFNNMLSVIISYAGLSRKALGDHPVAEDIREIERAGQRAAELTTQLLAFSRQQVIKPKLLDLNASVTAMDRMLRRLIGSNIDLKVVCSTDLAKVLAEPTHVEQVVMNLAVNARDAMPQGGTLTIETANVELDEAYARDHLGMKPGPHVMLAVSDTGSGMSPETQARIFEPFFTTKEEGQGTGLGLATVFGITTQLGGSVWVYSEPDRGTTFKVYFPAAPSDARTGGETATRAAAATRKRPDKLRVLVVEDQQQVRALVAGLLERMGHHVTAPESPALALEAAANGARFDLLLTDLVMPGMDGRQLAEQLRRRRPEMRVLFMSGFTAGALANNDLLQDGAAFLQKPITPAGLDRAIDDLFV